MLTARCQYFSPTSTIGIGRILRHWTSVRVSKSSSKVPAQQKMQLAQREVAEIEAKAGVR